MTVGELIEALSGQEPAAEVRVSADICCGDIDRDVERVRRYPTRDVVWIEA